jgi:hypothetical protein
MWQSMSVYQWAVPATGMKQTILCTSVLTLTEQHKLTVFRPALPIHVYPDHFDPHIMLSDEYPDYFKQQTVINQ